MVIIKFDFDDLDTFFKILKNGYKETIKKAKTPIDIPLYSFKAISLDRDSTEIDLNNINYIYFLEGLKKFSNNKKYRLKKDGYIPRKDDFSYKMIKI